MKLKLTSSLFILVIVLLLSCSDTNETATSDQKKIQGSWTLINSYGALSGSAQEFETGTIVWNFDSVGKVTISNNNSDTAFDDSYETGIYNYSLVKESNSSNCRLYLNIENENNGCLIIVNNTMYLGDNFADGPNYYFQKQ